jgi:hypothetical protein
MEDRCHSRMFAHVCMVERQSRWRKRTKGLDSLDMASEEVVYRDNSVALLQQALHRMRTDVSSASGHEYIHVLLQKCHGTVSGSGTQASAPGQRVVVL